jgi:hypothetical protein
MTRRLFVIAVGAKAEHRRPPVTDSETNVERQTCDPRIDSSRIERIALAAYAPNLFIDNRRIRSPDVPDGGTQP